MMFYFKKANQLTEEERHIIRQKKPIIDDAIKALRRTNFTNDELREYEASEDIRRTEVDRKNELESLRVAKEAAVRALERAREEGREEGRNEEKRALKRMLDETINAGENVDAEKVGRWLE